MGIEILLKTLLSAMGYDKSKFDTIVNGLENKFSDAKIAIDNFQIRLDNIERNQIRILELLDNNSSGSKNENETVLPINFEKGI